MAYEYRVGGLNLIAVNEVPATVLNKLSNTMSLAKKRVRASLLQTQRGMTLIDEEMDAGASLADAVSYLHTDFFQHLQFDYQLDGIEEVRPMLDKLNTRLKELITGMSSPTLRIAEYGYHWFAPKNAKAYVMGTLGWAWKGTRPTEASCLNIDPTQFHNDNDLNLRFDEVEKEKVEVLMNTLIHEASHKYLGTYDFFAGGFVCEGVKDYIESWGKSGLPVPKGQLDTLGKSQLLNDAYVLTHYIEWMPDVNLAEFAEQMKAIGGVSNQAVFSSIRNDDL